jgi:predicted ATPase
MTNDQQQLRISRLELRNWRNFRQAELDLEPRTFLVGPNASGKSNLLDAVRFLHDLVAVGGGFEDAVDGRGGVSSLRCLAARAKPDIEINMHLGGEVGRPIWRYELSFGQTAQRKPALKRERVYRGERRILDRPNAQDKADSARLSQTFLEQVNANREFRAIADFLRTVRYRHIVPQLIREPDRSVGKHDDPFGGDLLEQIANTQKRTRDARLRRIAQALAVAVPQLQKLELYQDNRGIHHLRGRYEHWRPQGAWQSESDFSNGTLRLLGLLWSVLDGHGPLLLEEPELSLHPEVVRYIPPMLARMQTRSKRQVLVSTQSTELLQDPGIGLNEVFLLLPGGEGTEVRPASSFGEIEALLEGGLTIGEAVMPKTRPSLAEQLSFFPTG